MMDEQSASEEVGVPLSRFPVVDLDRGLEK